MDNQKTMLVLTSKNLETMLLEGGCGHWKANETSIRHCQYIVATRNKRSTWVQGPESHGEAFLIGEVDGAIPIQDRFIVKISRYAEINKVNVWTPGGSNPVRYVNLEDLGIDISTLEWKEWPKQVNNTIEHEEIENTLSKNRPLSINEAKEGLAMTFGVGVDSIEITIRA